MRNAEEMPAAEPENEFDGYPPAFLERIREQFAPGVVDRILSGMDSNRVTGFRVNRLVTGGEDAMGELRGEAIDFTPVEFTPDAAWVLPETRQKLLFSRAHEGKRIYVQNLASMLPVLELAPLPGERILDLTAAPGSKTLQIAQATGEASEIAAVEVSRGRYFRMKANLEQFGAGFVRTFQRDGATVWRDRPEYFDRVLLDAPCASEGRFRAIEPETTRYWSPRKTSEMTRKQKRLLYSAVQSLRPGGILVYSTCSLAAEENEAMVSRILKRFPGALETEPLSTRVAEMIPPMTDWKGKVFDERVRNARRILPSERMEGFFLCRIRKTASTLEGER